MTKITSIHPILEAIRGKEEFIVVDKGDYKVVDYVFQTPETFDNPLLLECRGIKFCKDNMILARPFRKFFNYGENGSGLPIHRPHVVTEKMDGSMVHAVRINGRMFLHTRKGHTDVAKKAEQYAVGYPGIVRLCNDFLKEGWTPIFEYVGPNNRIVIRYDEERLVLLAARNIVTGEMMKRTALHWNARNYGVDKVFEHGNIGDKDAFLHRARTLKDREGFVVYFDDGYMVKVKADEYVLQHRALDDMSSKKKIVALCAQGFMDDVLPTLDEKDKHDLIMFNSLLQAQISKHVNDALCLADEWSLCRKDFAIKVAPTVEPRWLTGVVFGLMDGKEARKMVIDNIIRNWKDVQAKWRGE